MSSQQRDPPCRHQFVLQWLEDHAKYFGHPASKPELPPLVTRIANRSFPSQSYSSPAYSSCQCNDAVQDTSNVVNKLYKQPPYKMSPMKPPPPPYTDPNNFAFFF